MKRADVVIIGGGPSGLCAAIGAARCGDQVLILEKYERLGKKLLATGNGRCNLMNLHSQPYRGDTEFASLVMGPEPVTELTAFWHDLGLMIRYDGEGRGYPCTFQSVTVLDVLRAECIRLGVEIHTGITVTEVKKHKNGFRILSGDDFQLEAERVIVATGGAAQPKLGGNRSAWPWLQALGHEFVPAEPALTALITDERSISGLNGLRAKCSLTVERDGFAVHRESGEILFTAEGISGICAMQCSRYAVPGRSECIIDFFPDLFIRTDQLTEELIRRKERNPGASPAELLRGLCAAKLSFAVCKKAGLALRGETAGELAVSCLQKIAEAAKQYRVRILDKEGFDRAQVMAGGLICRDFDPKTMMSCLHPGLHAAGELLNVDGDCGGYNLMFAFLSGLRAGQNGRRAG